MIKRAGFLVLVASIACVPLAAMATPKEKVLHHFTGTTDGGTPHGELVADAAGTLYGTTSGGGAHGFGTVYALKPPTAVGGAWTFKLLHAFKGGSDGAVPLAGLIRNKQGALFGTTSRGGGHDLGTVFRLNPPEPGQTAWSLRILHRFADAGAGANPQGALILAGGVLFGSTSQGGNWGCGTVFSLTPPTAGQTSWTHAVLRELHHDKEGRYLTTLARDAAGNLYGATTGNGAFGHGTVFWVKPPAPGKVLWTSAVLHAFKSGTDGADPTSGPILGPAGEVYGTTQYGGTGDKGTIYRLTPPGPGQTAWPYTVLYRFTGTTDGSNPYAGLRRDADGVLHGTTTDLGYGGGTLYSLTPPTAGSTTWTKKIFHRFGGASDGVQPYAAPLLATGAVRYGTTGWGGTYGYGVVYRAWP